MGLLNYLVFDNINSSTYGVYIAGDGVFNAPARRGEMVSIPGRNGSLFLDNGAYDNIEVEYPGFIGEGDEAQFRTKLTSFRSALASKTTYKRLEDTYHPDEFRLAIFRSGMEVDPQHYDRAGEFSILFDCKPQRFLKSGEIPQVFSANGTILNPTLFESKPLIKVTGDGSVSIDPYRFTVTDNPGTIYIDSEIGEAYLPMGIEYDWTDESGYIITDDLNAPIQLVNGSDTVWSAAEFVSFENSLMPMINAGSVSIGMTGTISLEIIPRWWTL